MHERVNFTVTINKTPLKIIYIKEILQLPDTINSV